MLRDRPSPTPAYRGVVMSDRDDRRIWFDTDATAQWLGSKLRGPGRVACDTESDGTGVHAFAAKLVTFSDGETTVALDPRQDLQAAMIRTVLTAADEITFHNSAFDVPVLAANGLMEPEHVRKVTDTLIWARLANPSPMVGKDLAALAKRHLDMSAPKIAMAFKAAGHSRAADGYAGMDIDSWVWVQGGMSDTRVTYMLTPTLISEAHTVIEAVADPASPWVDWASVEPEYLVHREQTVNRCMLLGTVRGLAFDRDYYDRWTEDHAGTVESAAERLAAAGLDPGGGAALVDRLDELGALPPNWPRTKKTGRLSAAAEHIERLTHPLAVAHLEYAQLTRERQYLDRCAELASLDGRVYPAAAILGASASGRMSYSNPEVHQFPGRARGVLLADESGLTSIDWSSIEPFTMANIAGERGMVEFYESGGDIYAPVMETADVDRKTAKVVLLAGMYGQGKALLAAGLSRAQDREVSVAEAAEIQDNVLSAMPNIRNALDWIRSMANQHSHVVTISGRPLPVPDFFNVDRRRREVMAYKGQNYVVQGSAYDHLAEVVVAGAEAGLAGTLRIAMHDELVVDTDSAEEWARLMAVPSDAFCRAVDRTPKLRVDRADMGERWRKPD